MLHAVRNALVLAFFLGSGLAVAGPVNINTADAETISTELTGVGMVKAEAIVAYREANGPFASAEDLLNVTGIGQRTIEINRADILTNDPGERKR